MLSLIIALAALPAPPQDFICYPGKVRVVATGEEVLLGTRAALDYAIEHSDTNGSVIECNGKLRGVSIAIGENYRDIEIVRADPIRVTMIPGPDHVSVGPISWGAKKNSGGLPGFAVEHLEWDGITFDGRAALIVVSGFWKSKYGDITFRGCSILSSKKGTKFGGRISGHPRSLTIDGNEALGGGQEHPWYVDNPTGDPGPSGVSIYYGNNVARGWGRTAGQFVTRAQPFSGFDNPGPAHGDLIIENNTAIDCGRAGAHNYTVTGWPEGTVYFRNNYGEAAHDTGLFISYHDPKQGDLLTEDGFAVRRLVWLDNYGIYPNSGRDMNGFSGVRELIIRGGNQSQLAMRGNRAAFNIKWNGVGNGGVFLESRISPNDWNLQTGLGPWRENKKDLTPAQVGAMWDDPHDPVEPEAVGGD